MLTSAVSECNGIVVAFCVKGPADLGAKAGLACASRWFMQYTVRTDYACTNLPRHKAKTPFLNAEAYETTQMLCAQKTFAFVHTEAPLTCMPQHSKKPVLSKSGIRTLKQLFRLVLLCYV